jgi:DnaJ-domain-containing protein 1
MGFFRLLCALWLFYVLFRVWRTLLQNLPPNPPGDSPFGGAGGRPFGHGPDPFEARPPPPPPPPPPPRAPRPPPARSPYDILGVSSQATRGEIKAAYQKLIRQYHPDLVSNLGPELRELAEQRTKEITGAYNALKRS